MIPQRKLTRTGVSNGISYRVEACRRRLRTIRSSEAETRIEECAGALNFEAPGMQREVSMIEPQERDEAGVT